VSELEAKREIRDDNPNKWEILCKFIGRVDIETIKPKPSFMGEMPGTQGTLPHQMSNHQSTMSHVMEISFSRSPFLGSTHISKPGRRHSTLNSSTDAHHLQRAFRSTQNSRPFANAQNPFQHISILIHLAQCSSSPLESYFCVLPPGFCTPAPAICSC